VQLKQPQHLLAQLRNPFRVLRVMTRAVTGWSDSVVVVQQIAQREEC
jgi:hypothetical protein